MRRLKIALLSRWYWEENRRHHDFPQGGTTQQLAEAVAALGHEVVVLSQSTTHDNLKKSQVGGLETWLSPRARRRNLFTALRDKMAKRKYSHRKVYTDALTLRDFLAQRGPFDVLWAQTESPDGLVAAVAARLGVKLPPVVVQIQALRYHFAKRGVPTPNFNDKPALGLAFRHATRILANSNLVAESLSAYARPDFPVAALRAKVHIVHPNLHRIVLQAAGENWGWPDPMKDRVLFLGALNPGKGPFIFLRALAKTEAAQRNAVFALIGDFTDSSPRFIKRWEKATEELRVRLPGARMEYLGAVSLYEVIRQIKLARVVVIPSLFDAFSRALAEALVLGRPVITTDKVGASPLVPAYQCGFVVPPGDSATLAQAIDTVLGNDAPYTENAARVAHRLIYELSPEAIALQLVQHFSEVAA